MKTAKAVADKYIGRDGGEPRFVATASMDDVRGLLLVVEQLREQVSVRDWPSARKSLARLLVALSNP